MRLAPAAALLLLAACSAEPQPAPSPMPTATPSPTPAPPAPAIDDRPQPKPKPGGVAAAVLPAPELEQGAPAAGAWTLKASATGAAALFGGGGEAARLAIRCDPQARTIAFVLPGATGAQLRVVTANGSAGFAAREAEGGLIAEAPARYTFLTQTLAGARQGFAVATEAGAVLRLPWGEPVAQVIQSCQPG